MTYQPRKCAGKAKSGKPCRQRADYDRQYCLKHDPDRVDELKAEMAKRGRVGAAVVNSRAQQQLIPTTPLKTLDDVRALLERATNAVENARGNAFERLDAVAKAARVALDIIKSDIERQAGEIEELLKTRPELRQLMAVK